MTLEWTWYTTMSPNDRRDILSFVDSMKFWIKEALEQKFEGNHDYSKNCIDCANSFAKEAALLLENNRKPKMANIVRKYTEIKPR